MTADAQSFTHLESLLLFQSVAAYGNTAESFARISNSLKSSELLQRDASDNNDRLNPQALTNLYLRLLKAEAKRSIQDGSQSTSQDAKKADAPSSSRRGEVTSPKLTSIEDADRHRHLEPLMIDRLYDLYKDQVVQEITEEEQQYNELVGQVRSLEAELELQGRIATSAADSALDNADPTSVLRNARRTLRENSGNTELLKEEDESAQEETDTKSQTGRPSSRDAASIDAILNPSLLHEDELIGSKSGRDLSSTAGALPKGSKTPSQLPGSESRRRSSLAPGHASGPSSRKQSEITSFYASSSNDQSLKGHIQSQPNAVAQVPNISHNRASPRRSPESVAPGINRSQPPIDQQKLSSLQHTESSRDQRQSHLQQQHHGQQLPLLPHAASLTPRAGGMQLPPFQVSSKASYQSQQAQQYLHSSGQASTKQGKAAPDLQISSTPVHKGLTTNAMTPAISKQTTLNEDSNVYSTPGSDTKWKAMSWNPGNALPRPRSVSPLSEKATSPEPAQDATFLQRQKTRNSSSVRETRKSKTTRASSKTPSAVISNQARTRSQSIVSYDDDGSFASAPGTTNDLKQSVSMLTADAQPSTRQTRATRNAATPTITTSLAGKRKRAPTIDTDTAPTPASTSGPTSPTPAASSIYRPPTDKGIPLTIIASRNFHKTSAPMLNNIGSHKHASLFSAPVSTKTAGYYDIIKRPTDLSSIRKAIAAGFKAVSNAAASGIAGSPSVSTPGAGGGSGAGGGDAGGAVTLPISKELLPPEAIVNSAQLEQEVMRMFANAVMFNEGDDGVVADAREMFEDTEKALAAWRGAEGNREKGEEVGVSEDAGAASGAPSAKRRRA